jgi:hypothetical protein
MVRRGTPIEPRLSFGLAALAVGAIVNFGLRIFHSGDISIMVLAWHFGAAALTFVAGHFGRFVLNWRTALPAAVPLR